MHILIATGAYAPQIGGPATYVKMLEEHLPKHQISVSVAPFNSVSHLPWGIRHLVYTFQLYKKAQVADLVYALDPVSVGVPAALVAKMRSKRFFVRIAGDYAWEQGTQRFKVTDHLDVFSKKGDEYLVPVLILKKIQKTIAEYAEKIIVPSEYFKGVIKNWGVTDVKKIIVIHSVPEEIPFQGRKADFRRMLKFNGKIVVSAGRLVPWKGFDTLISLVPEFIKKYPSFKLLIAGDGPDMSRLEKMVEKKKLHEHVALTGSLEQAVLFKYIRMADVFVLNTNYEGFSHQLLEVMGIGTPIVTTNVGGNPELITDEKNGLLVKYNNKKELFRAVSQILDNESLATRLVRNGKERLAQHTPENMVKKFVTTLKI